MKKPNRPSTMAAKAGTPTGRAGCRRSADTEHTMASQQKQTKAEDDLGRQERADGAVHDREVGAHPAEPPAAIGGEHLELIRRAAPSRESDAARALSCLELR